MLSHQGKPPLAMKTFLFLTLPLLVTAASFGFTILAASIYAERPAAPAAAPEVREHLADREFLIVVEAEERRVSRWAEDDRSYLAKLDEEDLQAIPRAAFVAPPRALRPVAAFRNSETADAALFDESVIPRATFVAPPVAAPVMAPEREAAVRRGSSPIFTRRAAILIYDGKVLSTRSMVMN